MDPVHNPFLPGAGSPPPELTGRDALLEQFRVAAERARLGRTGKSLLLIGVRGVGKTVLLERMRETAEERGLHPLRLEAQEQQSLPGLLAPALRVLLLKLSRHAQAKELATRALRGLAGFVNGLKLSYADIELGMDLEAEPGLADIGDLEPDLRSLLEAVGQAARKANTAVLLLLDELQYVQEKELAALISALHHCAQRRMPVLLSGAGLPHLRTLSGQAKSYAERLFDFIELGPLDEKAAAEAIEKPILAEGAKINRNALARIVEITQGYPYFLQEWGKHSWDTAPRSPIRLADVEAADEIARAALDAGFFRVRFEQLTPREKAYLRGMAELGAGPHRSGEVAALLSHGSGSLSSSRNSLLRKGMIYSPGHGMTAFSVPLFHEFMKRMMPFHPPPT